MFLGNDGIMGYTIPDSDFEAMVDLLRRGWIAADAAAMGTDGEFRVEAVTGRASQYAVRAHGSNFKYTAFFDEKSELFSLLVRGGAAGIRDYHAVGNPFGHIRSRPHWVIRHVPASTLAMCKLFAALYAETRPILLGREVEFAQGADADMVRMCPRIAERAKGGTVAHFLPDEYEMTDAER